MTPLKTIPTGLKTLTVTFIKHFIDTFFITTKHENTKIVVILICLIIFSFLTFNLQYKKSNLDYDIPFYTLNLLPAKTPKSIRNSFCDVFVHVSGIKSI